MGIKYLKFICIKFLSLICIFWCNVKNDDIDFNIEVNNCINCIFMYWIFFKDGFNGYLCFV